MSGRANALRLQVETALAGRVASPFEYRERQLETVPAGVPEIDRLTGGLPRGGLTEICGPAGAGRMSVLMAAMAARTAATEVCALVDARDAFDPQSAAEAGVRLGQLLWVRCRNVDQALRAADLLIQGGGFGLIALDLGDTPARLARAIPLPVWFRMRRAVENTPTILVAVEQEPNAKTCASLVLRMEAREMRWTETFRRDGFEDKFEEKTPPSEIEGGAPGNPQRTMSSLIDEIGENPHPLHSTPKRRSVLGTPEILQRMRHPERQKQIPTLKKRAWGTRNNEEPTRDGQIFLPHAQGCLFEGARNYAEVIRSRAKREGDRMTWREETTEETEFETRMR